MHGKGQGQDGGFASRLRGLPVPFLWAALYVMLLALDGSQVQFYCDESSFLKNVAAFAVNRNFEPVYTNYPTFFSYLIAAPIYAVYFIYYVLVRRFPPEGLFDARLFALVFQGDLEIWLWVGRTVTILCAAGILLLVYRYCATRLGRAAALWASFLLICSPYSFYMMYARYSLPDVFVALLVTAALYLAMKHVERPEGKPLYLAAFLAGLAASAKLNGAVAVAPLLVLPWLVPDKISGRLRSMALTAVCALAGFFAGSPYNVLRPGLYSSGFGEESGLLYGQAGGLNYQWLLPSLWREDPVMTALLLAVIGFSLWRRSRKDMVFHALLIASVVFLGGLTKRMPHYFIFLFPWVCVLAGELIRAGLKIERPRLLRWLMVAGAIVLAVYNGRLLISRTLHNARPNNLAVAREWIRDNLTARDRILLDADDVPRMGFIDLGVMPPYEYLKQNKYPSIVREYLSREMNLHFSYLTGYGSLPEELRAQGWNYFVTSETCLRPYLEDPSRIDAVESGPPKEFVYYLGRRSFYLRLWQGHAGVTAFKDGSGPAVYIFRLK